jgi:nicotinate-nucleotide pyrophosphorylase (carboxylating)
MRDLRDEILKSVTGKKITASIISDDDGIVAETGVAAEEAKRLGLVLEKIIDKGSQVTGGDEIARFHGSPKQVVMAEDILIGLIAKPSGIATAAGEFVKKAGQRPKIVCGAWKKMPGSLKDTIRRAVVTGGAHCRISQSPFVYLDKNYLTILGGIKESLEAVENLTDHIKVVQLKGRYDTIAKEACEAVEFGASILFIDTGLQSDVELVVKELNHLGLRGKVNIAFGGDIRLGDIDELKTLDIDILDIGRQIVDAPLLDMRLDVVDTEMV